MAISYKKYVDVTSSYADAGAKEVDLTGLVFLPNDAAMKNDSPLKNEFDSYKMVTLTASNYAKCFAEPSGSTDDSKGLYDFCGKYFGYVSPNGSVATTLRVLKMKTATDSATASVVSGEITAPSVTAATFKAKVVEPGEYVFVYATSGSTWKLNGGAVDLDDYGIGSVTSPSNGDSFKVTLVTAETPRAALERACDEGDSFGTFYFIGETNADKLKNAAVKNHGFNNDYRMVIRVSHTSSSADDYYTKYGNGETGSGFAMWNYSGLTFTECPYLSMAICSATDYDGTATATTHEFKTLNGETSTVTTDEIKEKLDGLRISYYGQTKANGAKKEFYQEGFNADGVDTACYDNEMWMKRTIVGELLSLEMSVEKIPPTPTGVAMVVNAITTVVNQALKNGSILPEKPIAESQRALVIQLCGGDKDAPYKLNQYGYILAADIVTYVEGNKQKYRIVYRLVYLKGDAVRSIEGTHNII